jgi:NADPH:quinone reductase-like Zn-dependent oxidoreductase
MTDIPATMKAVVNKRQGDNLVYGLAEVPTPTVSDEKDLIIKVEAAPINPSDIGSVGILARFGGDSIVAGEAPSTVAVPFPQALAGMFKADGDTKPVGNEGAGVVVAAGSAPEAQALLGKRVAVTGGSSYAQYTKTSLNNPMFAVLPDDVTGLEGASVFVNPLTVLGFIHTTKQEGHKAIVHTAAASQLGRMLVKQCKEEGIPLVNIVRKEEGVEVLKAIGAEFVVNSSLPSFKEDLLAAVKATGATVAFDATGGGTLAMDILTAFDTSLRQLYPDQVHPAYGPAMVRTVYKYGLLDKRNSEFLPSVGVGNWSWAGWLMPFHFAKYGEEHRAASIKKAVAGLKTTFSTSFGTNLSLEDLAKSPEEYLATLQSQTDKKFVVLPNGPL